MRIFSIFYLLICLCLSTFAGKPVDVLLCAYDTGDSNIMKRLLPEITKNNMTYAITAFGRGVDIFKDEKMLHILKSGSLENRGQLLSETDIRSVQKEFEPKIVLAGMASAGQAQVLNAFPKSQQVAIYDNFDPPEGKEFIQPFVKTVGPIHLYMVCAVFLVAPFQDLFKGTPVEAVGQPALEEWRDVFESTDRTKLRKDLGLEMNQKVIVFAGGTDDTYKKNLDIFVRTVARHPHWKVFVTYHPKTDGSVERAAVKDANARNIKVSNDIKTNSLATIADVLVCHKSSVCQQAFSVGVSCVYVAGKEYHNFLTDQKLVIRVETEDQLEKYLTQKMLGQPKLWATRLKENQEIMTAAGIPSQASEGIVSRLKRLMEA